MKKFSISEGETERSTSEVRVVDKDRFKEKSKEEKEVFDLESVKKKILENTEECNEECLKE